MSQYIFLDNWVLSNYTKPDRLPYLSSYIKTNELTVLVDSLSLIELYNPGWENAPENDRIARAIKLIGAHQMIIIDPVSVFRAEIEHYPRPLQSLPAELDLGVMSAEDRQEALELFLHHDEQFIRQGKDIRIWDASYKKVKAEWLGQIDKIIDNAIQSGVLSRDKKGRFSQLEREKENFLETLDRRHFSHFNEREREQLGTKIVELFMGATSKLPAVRFTSLCFWYAYVETDKHRSLRKLASDIGDFYQMSMIPYCQVFTIDGTMQWLSERIIKETGSFSCIILNERNLDKEIGFLS